ncbi:MAG: MBOAT family protein [Lachnospiraceae bacterium]|nr:MBOAT family protein [Lachnospiraceae bacterium]
MIFNSVSYLIFFPIVVLLYFALPYKLRNVWLLVVSYYFYMNWNAKYALLLAGSTLITFICSLMVSHFQEKEKQALAKCAMAGSFLINLGILFIFKYNNFFAENINRLMEAIGQGTRISAFDIVLPVGISFYIFQALSYTMDVYRGQVKATKNLLRYALFVSFFPQLVAGPIERSQNLLSQFDEKHNFDIDRIRSGLLTMLWGLFMKIVIADNLSGIVTKVYDNYLEYTGVEILLATALFAFQIYCDFGGYSAIAIGSARVLGFRLMENFKCPYLAISVDDFWKRWHISLTSWFRDYLYIPLGGNRKGTARKYMNIMIIFLVSGLWHGANWTYVVWGGINGLYLVIEQISEPLRRRMRDFFHVDVSRFSYRFFAGLWTFILVDFSWMFFRAENFSQVFGMLRQTKANFGLTKIFGGAVAGWGLDEASLLILVFAFILLFFVDLCKYRGINLNKKILMQGAPLRYMIYLILLFVIMFFGVYGYEYAQTAFIYFQF